MLSAVGALCGSKGAVHESAVEHGCVALCGGEGALCEPIVALCSVVRLVYPMEVLCVVVEVLRGVMVSVVLEGGVAVLQDLVSMYESRVVALGISMIVLHWNVVFKSMFCVASCRHGNVAMVAVCLKGGCCHYCFVGLGGLG